MAGQLGGRKASSQGLAGGAGPEQQQQSPGEAPVAAAAA